MRGRPLSFARKHQVAVDWLVSHEFASKTSENKMVLLSSCLESRITLSAPALVQPPADNTAAANTLFGYRKKMLMLGWKQADSHTPATVGGKVFRVQNCVKMYYELLLTRC